MIDFVNLHNHTTFSILSSLISVKDLFKGAKELNQTAVAITDHGSLGSASEALKISKETGVKLIMGCEMYFLDDVSNKADRFRHIILLAKNATGYRNLLTLNKEGFDNGTVFAKKVYPLIDWKMLEKRKEGLICLTSCSSGIIAQLVMNKKMEKAEEQLLKLKEMFGNDLGLEIQANTLKRNSSIHNDVIEQVYVNNQLIKLGRKHNIRLVATSNAHYLKKEDADTHDTMLAIGSHQPKYSNFRQKYDCPEFYLKSGDEVFSFFERNYGEEAAKEFCFNSLYFADKCEVPEWISPKYSNPSGKELPIFPVSDEPDYAEFKEWSQKQDESVQKLEEDKQFLRYKCFKNLPLRVSANVLAEKLNEYQERIKEELEVLEHHNFSSYMLIVSDYLNWARKNNVLCGAGRGSIGGSLIAYLINIHQADPIKYNLVFARFLNKHRSVYPDCDSDFNDRDAVEAYCRKKYGDECVARVSNINTVTPKVFARDIARACEFGGSREKAVQIGTDIADTLPTDIKTIDDALNKVPLFAQFAERYSEIKKHSAICGKFRALSTHAAGIIINRRSLVGLVPLRREKDGILCLEYDKDVAEENGLVKMDLLGLTTLNDIEGIHNLITANNKPLPSLPDFDAYDKETYDLISAGNTFGVFQLGTSSGTIDLCRKIKPKSLIDISYVNSLTRPSAKDMRRDFIKTKNGEKEYSLLHPKLERAFKSTFGFGLYEESLFFLAQDVAGWDMHSADRLRKMTKEKGKNSDKNIKLREEFISGSIKNNVNEHIATRIWDEVIAGFQGYGFNQSHSIFYSMMAYTEAYLKAHYPLEFLLAKLMNELKSNSPAADGNVAKYKNEIRKHKIKIIPPDINKSDLRYKIENDCLITGLDALKFVSDDAINDIISKRPFASFQDFMARVSSRYVRANTIQALACSGCLDSFKISRQNIFYYCSDYRKKLQVWMKKHNSTLETFSYPFPETDKPWKIPESYAQEQFYLGEGFICKKKNAYNDFFKDDNTRFASFRKAEEKTRIRSMKAIVSDMFEFKVKKPDSKYVGMSMLKLTMEDADGDQCSVTIFPDRYEKMQKRIQDLFGKRFKFDVGCAIHFSGSVNFYAEEMGIILDEVFNIAPPPQRPADLKARKVTMKMPKKTIEEQEKTPIFEQIEDWAIEEGLVEPDEDED